MSASGEKRRDRRTAWNLLILRFLGRNKVVALPGIAIPSPYNTACSHSGAQKPTGSARVQHVEAPESPALDTGFSQNVNQQLGHCFSRHIHPSLASATDRAHAIAVPYTH
jgi:hypothetical protein